MLWLKRPRPNLDELRALAARTIADARRAADIIRRIRDMATRTETERSRVALNAVVQEVLLFLGPELRRQGVETTLHLAAALPDVMGDRVQLQQVFVNLAVNAQYAMAGHERRQLVIRTERVEGDVVRAEIEDTGHGIPPENLNQLFQSFFTTKRGGMGIGLEAHGGSIEATNRPGGGAPFRFTLGRVPIGGVAGTRNPLARRAPRSAVASERVAAAIGGFGRVGLRSPTQPRNPQ